VVHETKRRLRTIGKYTRIENGIRFAHHILW
jgi:hypothetical protein